MSTSRDFSKYYAALGLEPGASLDDVKRSYRSAVADYEEGRSSIQESEIDEIETAYFKLSQHLQEPSSASRYGQPSTEQNLSLRQVPWGPLGAILVAALAFFGADILAFLLFSGAVMVVEDIGFEAASTMVASESTLLTFAVYITATLATIGAVLLYVRHKGGRLRTLGFRRFNISTASIAVLVGIVGYYIGAGVVLVLAEALPTGIDTQAQQDIPFSPTSNLELMATFVAIVLAAPIVEEAIFRGFLLPALNKVMRLPFAVTVVSLLFAVLHPPLVTMLAIGVFSVILCLVYIKTGSIWPAIILHAIQNFIAFTLLFVVDIERYLPAEPISYLFDGGIAV